MATALTVANLTATLNWSQTITVTGFNSSTQTGPLMVSNNPTLSASDADFVYPIQGTLAAGASITINLFSLTGLGFAPDMAPVRAYQMLFKGVGATWSYGPAAALGLNWFLGGTTPIIQGGDGEGFAFVGKIAVTIDNGDKNVKITNTSGGNTLTYSAAFTLGA